MSSIKRLCMLETNEFLSYQPYLELNNNYQWLFFKLNAKSVCI